MFQSKFLIFFFLLMVLHDKNTFTSNAEFWSKILDIDVYCDVKQHLKQNVHTHVCWGCNHLRPCSEAKDCQLYNDEVTQPRNKTLKTFWRFCVQIYCRFVNLWRPQHVCELNACVNVVFFICILTFDDFKCVGSTLRINYLKK